MLSQKARKLIYDYLNLPFSNVSNVRCPYFIGSKRIARGQLRSLAGKGTPQEIVEEAKIMSIQYGHDILDKHGLCHLPEKQKVEAIRKYLIDHDLGIDCSGLVTHILRAHFKETNNIDLVKYIHIISACGIYRRLVAKLRPIENIGISTLADDANTMRITRLNAIESGDMITMLKTGPNKKRDHILLITDIENKVIKYVHARAWSSEGKYGHGVMIGQIKITDPNKNLLEQEWEELRKIGEENETYLEAKRAERLEIRRVKLPNYV